MNSPNSEHCGLDVSTRFIYPISTLPVSTNLSDFRRFTNKKHIATVKTELKTELKLN